MADGFGVVPAALIEAAGRLDGALAELRAQTPVEASVGARAWGLLGEETGLHARYDELLHAASRALEHLRTYLEDATINLARTAARYAQQEHDAAMRIEGSHR
jgi:Excreted virulence factor EspC, type VII ESX diderm